MSRHRRTLTAPRSRCAGKESTNSDAGPLSGPFGVSAWAQLWIGQAISSLGSRMLMFTLPLVAFSASGSLSQAALPASSFFLSTLAFTPFGGSLSDQYGKRRVLIAATMIQSIVSGIVGALLVAFTVPVWALIAAAAALGASSCVVGPCVGGLSKYLLPRELLASARSASEARAQAASIMGPPLGGLLYEVCHWGPFAVDSVSTALFTVVALRMRVAEKTSGHARSAAAGILEGVRFIWRKPVLRYTLAFAAIINLGESMLMSAAVLGFSARSDAAGEVGMVRTLTALGALLGSIMATRYVSGMAGGKVFKVSAFAICIIPSLCLLHLNVWSVGLAVGAAFASVPFINGVIFAYQLHVTDDSMVGRVIASVSFVAMALMPLGPALGGYLVDRVGLVTAIVTSIVIMAISILPLLVPRELRQLGPSKSWS